MGDSLSRICQPSRPSRIIENGRKRQAARSARDVDPKVDPMMADNRAIATFAAKFCHELDKNKSVVSSPLSAEVVLALLTLGSTEPAHSELLAALGIASDDAIRSIFSSLSSKLGEVKGVTLNMANRVYLAEGPHELEQALQEDAVRVFDAAIEQLDFTNGAAAAQIINQWIESKTNSRIKDLISKDSLNEDTRLVLVNAVYFKGRWTNKFNPERTNERKFHVNDKTTIKVPMMFLQERFRYKESQALKAKLLEMSYEGGEVSLLIVLPNEIEGLGAVLQKLAGGHNLMEKLDKMYWPEVIVGIPKFKIETEIDLNILLPKLGIKAIFNEENSGLTKLLKCKSKKLFVSKAVQKAFIEVNEEGTEAAAATGMVKMVMRSGHVPPPPKEFVADHPFLYALLHGRTTLFVGVFHPN